MASKRRRITVGVAVTATVAVLLGVGIGTANAGTRKPWWERWNPKPRPVASASATPSPSVTTAAPTASPRPSAPASAAPSPSRPATAPSPTPSKTTSAGTWAPPPANAGFDYQIGGAYAPPSGVTVVSRDSEVSPAAGIYNICYINAFQAQPGAESWWKSNHPDLLLRDKNGELVVDEDWDELMLDFSTPAKRTALTTIVGGWIDRCAAKGFKAIEPDNLDSYTRSNGLLTQAQAVEYAASLSAYAHGKGLAVGQKNLAELSTAAAKKAGFDFAVAEECAVWNECGAYTATYGNNVIVIEYTQSGFTKACTGFGGKLSVVLRDVDVTAPGSRTYVFKGC
ncbi:endo alpha-1,4 polygalactosaminidase [Catenuloplanes atrovinosus]|uniref:Glycoside-hydrolase family GH114 TIM-barrel domain-containing protein n=1 Tax=Catenuloplanes atrovinosus TaxID=137266 RepID=A0AAE4CCU2_9ACTN|nr:endo alpha-1,4 polygalactosaminidase [Catenuloplanes atrovinosus]MDR7276870.1 hypothetical protein [Catenuloplanes atrovinosus]